MINSGRWFPLESNPPLLNAYISKLGFDTSKYQFVDVFSTEDWALDMVPQPVAAVIMLYPITEPQEAHRANEKVETIPNQTVSDKVWFTAQRIGNACGTIGILHALANLSSSDTQTCIKKGSWLDRFYASCPRSFSPADKAAVLENDKEIETMHDDATADDANQTGRGELDDDVKTHFVALVNVDGELYELDGRKDAPIKHGNTEELTFLKDACGKFDCCFATNAIYIHITIPIPKSDGIIDWGSQFLIAFVCI